MHTKKFRKNLGIYFVLVLFLAVSVLPLLDISQVAAMTVGGGGSTEYVGTWQGADKISLDFLNGNPNVVFTYNPIVYQDAAGTYYDMYYDLADTAQCKDAIMFNVDPSGDLYPQYVLPNSASTQPCVYDWANGNPVVISTNQPAAAYLTAISPVTATYGSDTYGGAPSAYQSSTSTLSNGNKDITLISETSTPGCTNSNTMLIQNYQDYKGPPTPSTTVTLSTYTAPTNQGPYGTQCTQISTQSVPYFISLALYSSSTNGNPFSQPSASSGSTTPANNSCPITDGDALTWVLCPIATMAQDAMSILSGWLKDFLYVPTSMFSEFESTSNTFRDIGEALLVVAGLVMVVSQAAGLEMFAAYTVRKALPRIILAAIGMALAWPILLFIITFFNDIGYWTQTLITEAAKVPNASDPGTAFTTAMEGIGAVTGGTVVAGALIVGAAIAGAAVIISLLGTLLLALFVGFLILTIRQLVIIVCLILAPLAIASAVLPGTVRLWNFWRNMFITTMMMFPIIMAVIGAGMALSYIAGQIANSQGGAWDFMAIAALIVPFVILPFTFRMAGGVMGAISGAVSNNGLVRGGFGAISAFRKNEFAYRHQQTMEGKNRLGSSALGGLYRRAIIRGGTDFSRRERESYRAKEQIRLGGIAAKGLEAEAGFAGMDDIATGLALQEGMTSESFLEQYRDIHMKKFSSTRDQATLAARQGLGNIEGAFGARLGSRTMRTMAFQAHVNSPSAYAPTDEGLMELARDATSMVRDGRITTSQAISMIKSNRGRADMSGIGGGDWARQITSMLQGNDITHADVARLRAGALNGTQPGALIAGRHETIEALAPTMVGQLDAAYGQLDVALRSTDPDRQAMIDAAQDNIETHLAQIAGLYDVMAQVSPENAQAMAAGVLSVGVPLPSTEIGEDGNPIPGGSQTVRALIEQARSRPPDASGQQRFLELRRELTSAYRADAAAAAAAMSPPPLTGPGAGPPSIRGM
jgi:hypothetical protein